MPPKVVRLKVVWRLCALNAPEIELYQLGSSVPGSFDLAGQVPGERPGKLQCLALQVGG